VVILCVFVVLCIYCTVYLLYWVLVVLCICCTVYLLYAVFVVLCVCCIVYLLYCVFVVLCTCTVYLLYCVFVVLCICCTVYLLYCVFVVLCICRTVFVVLCICCTVYLLYWVLFVLCIRCIVCIDVFTLDAGLLASSQYSEGPATDHLYPDFCWLPFVFKQMLRWFPTFQVATICFSSKPPDVNLIGNQFHVL
jgi:hypothetical protein